MDTTMKRRKKRRRNQRRKRSQRKKGTCIMSMNMKVQKILQVTESGGRLITSTATSTKNTKIKFLHFQKTSRPVKRRYSRRLRKQLRLISRLN